MAETTPHVVCGASEWTLISDGNASISFQWRDDDAIGKWTFGATIPDVATTDFFTVRPKSPQNINDLTAGAKIWAMPYGDADRIMETVIP